MSNLLALRDDLRCAVLNYADIRRLKAYRDLSELNALFDAIIECARAVIIAEDDLGLTPLTRPEEQE